MADRRPLAPGTRSVTLAHMRSAAINTIHTHTSSGAHGEQLAAVHGDRALEAQRTSCLETNVAI